MDTDLIDIHTHIVPGLDDGAPNLQKAVEMAAIAARDGIKSLVATPHVMRGAFENNRTDILKKVQDLNLCIKVQNIKLTVLPGAEYYMEEDLPERLAAGQLLTINDTGRYLLVEFPLSIVPAASGDVFQGLISQGVTPIIAHPERNKQILKNPQVLMRFLNRGVLAQVNAGSIRGMYGKEIQECAWRLIETGAAHFVASDAHTTHTRAPVLSDIFAQVEKRLDRETAMILMCRNPWRVTRGRPILNIAARASDDIPSPKPSPKMGLLPKKLRLPWGQAPSTRW